MSYFSNAPGTGGGGSGTVTSINASGGTTGLTFSGGPVTTSGTLTLAGILAVTNGGTGSSTAFTLGSVVFAGASGVYTQDNSNFFWDNTNKRLGIATTAPVSAIQANTTDAGTTTIVNAATFSHTSSGTAAANFGTSIELRGSSATVAERQMALWQAYWVTATDATRYSRVEMFGIAAGAQTKFLQWGRGNIASLEILGSFSSTSVLGSGASMSVINGDSTVANVTKINLAAQNTGTFAWLASQSNNLYLGTGNSSRIALTMLNAGQMGTGTVTTPTAWLHLQAGTATPSTAPLKFNSGTLLGTPEAGAVEFLTDVWYGTVTTGAARRSFAMLESTQTWTATQTMTSPKFITSIADTNANPVITITPTASAVNSVGITNAATGVTGPLIQAAGETNVDLRIAGKGTGKVNFISATYAAISAMGAQAIDGSLANTFTRTLAASEVFTQSNFSTGQYFMVKVRQGSGTSYTVTWFSGITWITTGAVAPVQTTTSNGYTTYGFLCTGTNTFDGYLVATQ